MALSQSAFSQFLIEPYAGWATSISGNYEGNNTSLSYSGTDSGARLGWSFKNLMVGIFGDYSWLYEKGSPYAASTTINIPVNRYNGGVFLGANLNGGFRLWGEYLFYVRDSYDMNDLLFNEGTGWGGAIGYLFNPKIAVNLEYRNITLNKNPYGTMPYNIVSQELLLTISFPIYPFN